MSKKMNPKNNLVEMTGYTFPTFDGAGNALITAINFKARVISYAPFFEVKPNAFNYLESVNLENMNYPLSKCPSQINEFEKVYDQSKYTFKQTRD